MSPQSSESKIHNPLSLSTPILPFMLHYVLCAWRRHIFGKGSEQKSGKYFKKKMPKYKKRSREDREDDTDRLWRKIKKLEEKIERRTERPPAASENRQREAGQQQQDPAPFKEPPVRDEENSSQKENIEDVSSNSPLALLEMNQGLPEIQELDEETLKLLGDDAASAAGNEVQFHPELALRWKKWICGGIGKESKKELLDKYPRTGNCILESQRLNPEVAASLNDTSKRRDKHFADSQCTIGSALSAIGAAATLVMNDKENEGLDRMQILELLLDAGKLLTEVHHQEAVARRAYILPFLDKKVKSVLENSCIDEFLFGENLVDKIKSAKAIEKVGLDLKPQPVAKKPVLRQSPSVNWKGPSAKFQGNSQAGSYQPNNQQSSNKQRFPQKTWKYQASKPFQGQPQNQTQPRPQSSQPKPHQKS